MSEAEVAYLQEKISDAKRNSRIWFIVCFVMVILFFGYGIIPWSLDTVLLILIILIASIILSLHYYSQQYIFTSQLEDLVSRVRCLKCGRRIPFGSEFCPICKASFKSDRAGPPR